jgi:hypothetical protein
VKAAKEITFTFGERALAAVGLAIAALALFNWGMWHFQSFGLTEKQLAILAFVPMFLIVYYVPLRAEARRPR